MILLLHILLDVKGRANEDHCVLQHTNRLFAHMIYVYIIKVNFSIISEFVWFV